MPKLLIFDAFTLLICEKNVAIYALLQCKIFSLKIWLCKIFDEFHVCKEDVLCVADEDDVTKIDVEETQDRRCSKSWLPDLKTTGRLKSLLHLNKYLSR